MGNKIGVQQLTGSYDLCDPVAALRLMVDPHGGRVTQISPWLIVVSGE